MGLRETNATRTRNEIADAAVSLFLEHGYDATTMESVAASAGVGLSTLYRYFPTKEALGTAYLGEPGALADLLLDRPSDEPVDEALGHALVDFVAGDAEPQHTGRVRALIDDNPRLHGRLLEWLMEMHVALTAALAHRRSAPADDIRAAALAWSSVLVLERASDRMRARTGATTVADAVREVIAELADADVMGPRLPRP